VNGNSARSLAIGILLAASLGSGWALAGCDDPNPTNCAPKPTCPPICLSASVVVSGPQTPRAHRSQGKSKVWLVLTLRTIAGAMRAM